MVTAPPSASPQTALVRPHPLASWFSPSVWADQRCRRDWQDEMQIGVAGSLGENHLLSLLRIELQRRVAADDDLLAVLLLTF